MNRLHSFIKKAGVQRALCGIFAAVFILSFVGMSRAMRAASPANPIPEEASFELPEEAAVLSVKKELLEQNAGFQSDAVRGADEQPEDGEDKEASAQAPEENPPEEENQPADPPDENTPEADTQTADVDDDSFPGSQSSQNENNETGGGAGEPGNEGFGGSNGSGIGSGSGSGAGEGGSGGAGDGGDSRWGAGGGEGSTGTDDDEDDSGKEPDPKPVETTEYYIATSLDNRYTLYDYDEDVTPDVNDDTLATVDFQVKVFCRRLDENGALVGEEDVTGDYNLRVIYVGDDGRSYPMTLTDGLYKEMPLVAGSSRTFNIVDLGGELNIYYGTVKYMVESGRLEIIINNRSALFPSCTENKETAVNVLVKYDDKLVSSATVYLVQYVSDTNKTDYIVNSYSHKSGSNSEGYQFRIDTRADSRTGDTTWQRLVITAEYNGLWAYLEETIEVNHVGGENLLEGYATVRFDISVLGVYDTSGYPYYDNGYLLVCDKDSDPEEYRIPVYSNETSAEVMLRALEQNGFEAKYNGNPKSGGGFYLTGIKSPTMLEGYTTDSIPQKLAEYIKQRCGIDVGGRSVDPDWLREKDIVAEGSGWGVAIDGEYLATSMSEYGAYKDMVIDMRYTLFRNIDNTLGYVPDAGSLLPHVWIAGKVYDTSTNLPVDEYELNNPPADKTALNAAIATIGALNEDDYTTESWAALATALGSAQSIAAYDNAMQDEVDTALAALNLAINNLVVKPVPPTPDPDPDPDE